MSNKRPTIVAVSGFSSNVGKTTLVCDLLKALPEWEAIKLSRGHYRSCGKDPEACCVSELLREEAVVRSGRAENYAVGKDTGRFWEAGATNVHWVIVTDAQVEQGIKQALECVFAPGVFIEGNSFLDFIPADFVVMVSRASGGKLKGSARRALAYSSAIYLSNASAEGSDGQNQFAVWGKESGADKLIGDLPIYTQENLPELIARLQRMDLSANPSARLIGETGRTRGLPN